MSFIDAFRRPTGTLLMAAVLGPCAIAGTPPGQGSDGPQPPHGPPPQVAIDACAKLADGAACSFTGRRGETINGSCHTPPQQSSLACVPAHRPMQPPANEDSGPSRGY